MNIAIGHIVKASDYTQLKTAIDNEYVRRGKPKPSGFATPPTPGHPVSFDVVRKIMLDIYNFDRSPSHNWTDTFKVNDLASAEKWKPVLEHLRSLMRTVVPRP